MQPLEGRTALVTGAGQGNGAAIAQGLTEAGARVVVTDMDLGAANATAQRLRDSGATAVAAGLDVTDRGAAQQLAAQLKADGWQIDLLVNNAGICPRVPVDSDDFDRAWDMTMNINLNGLMHVTRAFLPQLRAGKGTVVNIASIAAFVAVRSTLAYSASKAGVRGLTLAMAQEFAVDGIRVNAVAPGQVMTPMLAPSMANPERRKEIEARILLGRVAEPSELVGPVVFLSSAMSSFVTGVTLPVDGGYLAT